MALTIRLMRVGKKGFPSYRIIAIDKRKKRNGHYIDFLGMYEPTKKIANFSYDKSKLKNWLAKGATMSEGLRKLLKKKLRTDLS